MGDATWPQGNWFGPFAEMIQAKMDEVRGRWEAESQARDRAAHLHGPHLHGARPAPGGFPFGRGDVFGPGFPFGPGFGPGPRGRRAPRRSRGDVRDAVLALLAAEPMHGYQLIQEITRRSGDTWRPSPGSVYPTLQQLEDEGLVRAEQSEGRRVMHLTDEGRAYVEEHADELGAIWKQFEPDPEDARAHPLSGLRDVAGSVAAAVMQVAVAGDADQQAQVEAILADTRRRIYRVLAGDDEVWEAEETEEVVEAELPAEGDRS